MSSIVTNVAALNGNRNLNNTNMKMGKVLEKLSSGYRINRAADDAAGLGISEKMRAQIRGNTQAIRNAQDGISMIQTAEGAMDEVHSILQRMRELGVQAANDTYDTAARTSIGTELVQLRTEIDRISNATNFNGQNLLTGTLTGTLGGVTANDLVVNDAVAAAIASSIEVAGSKADTYTFTYAAATDTLTLTNSAGIAQNVTLGAIAANGTQVLNFSQHGIKVTLNSAAGDTADNIGAALALAANDTIVVSGTGAAALQVGANTTAYDTMNISFNDSRATSATGLNLVTGGGVDWTSSATVVASNTASQAFINQIDTAITTLNTRRSDLGAAQNRLEHTVNSLGVSVENLTASESRIRDADVAELSSQMASNQILQQAGTAVLAQANQASQSVLTLLRG
ncbi:MAG: flagellin [Dehalococcoidia bacterium]|uniref:flagellin N-terminal helical domain-containing protein n=1 Tax=Candidatus Amarobacter glycogenicus TaxID=3140699 RepID=UPI003136205E|nr:flagellin [Dehalococcoidia bacterium]MBK7127061.1 flagellin [Dehalococcoidia bacterium]MBK9547364.1 flagellin [Dehalococcoidia bacterium]